MGADQFIHLYTNTQQMGPLFLALVDRLVARGEVGTIDLHIGDMQNRPRRLDLPSMKAEVERIQSQIKTSDEMIYIFMPFETIFGWTILLTVRFRGDQFARGRASSKGNILVSTDTTHLYGGMSDSRWKFPKKQPPRLKLWRTNPKETAVLDGDDLFLTACGADAASEAFDHGLVERETLCPPDCQMVFHKDRVEYLADLSRIYAHYRLGLLMPPLLRFSPDEVLKLAETELAELRNHSTTAQALDRLDDGKRDFIERLPGRIAAIPAEPKSQDEALEPIFARLQTALPQLTVYQTAGGIAICARPLSNLWPAYEYIARSLDK